VFPAVRQWKSRSSRKSFPDNGFHARHRRAIFAAANLGERGLISQSYCKICNVGGCGELQIPPVDHPHRRCDRRRQVKGVTDD
jgi:hypothetical protein